VAIVMHCNCKAARCEVPCPKTFSNSADNASACTTVMRLLQSSQW